MMVLHLIAFGLVINVINFYRMAFGAPLQIGVQNHEDDLVYKNYGNSERRVADDKKKFFFHSI